MPKLPLPNFLDALSVSGATDSTWQTIIDAGYDTLEKILAVKPEVLSEVSRPSGVRIGENAYKICASLASPRIQPLLARADEWLDTSPSSTPTDLLPVKLDVSGLNVVVTGTGPAPRDKLIASLRAAGAVSQGSVSKTTHLLVCGNSDKQSSKAKKAEALGTRVMGYDEVF